MLIESQWGRPPFDDMKFSLSMEHSENPFGTIFLIKNSKGEVLNKGNRVWISHKWKIWTGKDFPAR